MKTESKASTNLNSPPVIHFQRPPRTLKPILRLEIHSSIIDKHVHAPRMLTPDCIDKASHALAVGDVEFRV